MCSNGEENCGEGCGDILYMTFFEVAREVLQRRILMTKLRAWMIRDSDKRTERMSVNVRTACRNTGTGETKE
jgi:hypothetical protein